MIIRHTCTISAVIKDERMAVAAEPEFSNKVCRGCALWGAPNAPCRQRLTYVRTGYSQVNVTCASFEKSLDLLLEAKLKELELAHTHLLTARHNLILKMQEDAKESNPKTTHKKMDKILRILEGKNPAVDPVLIRLQAQEAEAETRIKNINLELSPLQGKIIMLPDDPNVRVLQ